MFLGVLVTEVKPLLTQIIQILPFYYLCSSNEEVVQSSDIIFLGLLPGPAREILPSMPFHKDHFVISMMAAVDINEVINLIGKVSSDRIVRTVPLPSNSQRSGPILLHPSNNYAEEILSVVGSPVVCHTEGNYEIINQIDITIHDFLMIILLLIIIFFILLNELRLYHTNFCLKSIKIEIIFIITIHHIYNCCLLRPLFIFCKYSKLIPISYFLFIILHL